ncbi:MAG TPA: family 1 glycosylhydrolase, partial [Actinomycetaceae bacterium]|nr:family 1 glycosylhydrolase [Actinomycetaceae bacterium]
RGMTELLVRMHREHPGLDLVVTENGAAFPDVVQPDGSIEDHDRIAYLRDHIRAISDAVAQGAPVRGYFVWSLLDNFEWGYGYSKRFGVVHVDYATQQRTLKASAHWYAELVRAHTS